MAFRANPIGSTLRTFASAVCLLAILLLTTPCPMAQQPASPAAMHCADCCNSNLALTTPQSCCASHPQPAQPSAINSVPAVTRIAEAILWPSAPLHARHRHTLISASTSPPPFPPILRI